VSGTGGLLAAARVALEARCSKVGHVAVQLHERDARAAPERARLRRAGGRGLGGRRERRRLARVRARGLGRR